VGVGAALGVGEGVAEAVGGGGALALEGLALPVGAAQTMRRSMQLENSAT
jgi:hypothetical protein